MTGSELVRGERTDLNGPFYARTALSLGLDPVRVTIVGDDPDALESALRDGLTEDVCLVSGGLGPTHDDRTVALIARAAGRELRLDEGLEQQIGDISRTFAARQGRPYADFAPGVRKQATVPEGAVILGLAGTAPGLVLETGACVVVVLPGPPGELQTLWPRALETDELSRVLAQSAPPDRRVLRFFGVSESAVARALAEAGGDGDGVEVTICARDFEIHVDLLAEAHGGPRADELVADLETPLEEYLFARTDHAVEEIVLDLCRERGLTLATAESCTGGLVAARLTSIPGASDVFRGAIVAYANDVKEGELGVSEEVLAEYGAVSAEAAAAMAHGARLRLGVDVAVAVTGVAGPDGGTEDKPVGTVFFHAVGPEGEEAFTFQVPGWREAVRQRSTVTALHIVRRLLTRNRHGDA